MPNYNAAIATTPATTPNAPIQTAVAAAPAELDLVLLEPLPPVVELPVTALALLVLLPPLLVTALPLSLPPCVVIILAPPIAVAAVAPPRNSARPLTPTN